MLMRPAPETSFPALLLLQCQTLVTPQCPLPMSLTAFTALLVTTVFVLPLVPSVPPTELATQFKLS